MKPNLITLCGLLMTAFLVGCGPGTGGTGTGTQAGLAAVGATAASVCAAPFGGSLSCALGTTSSGTPSVSPPSVALPPSGMVTVPPAAQGADLLGTAAVRFYGASLGINLVVDFDGNGVHLDARCLRLNFEGDWGIAANNDARFYGSTLADGSLQRQLASLTVQGAAPSSAVGAELLITLRDAEGRPLLGPEPLQRAGALAPGAGPC